MALFFFFRLSVLSLILIIGPTQTEKVQNTSNPRKMNHTFEPGVLGNYENIIIVRADNTVDYGGKNHVGIEWINPYAFYFKFTEGNEQIWIYDTIRFCLIQIGNKVNLDFIKYCRRRSSPNEHFQELDRNMGNFRYTDIYENTVNHFGKEVPISWINAHAFYFYHDVSNLQVWVYDAETESYLQLGTWENSVKDAHARLEDRTYSRVYAPVCVCSNAPSLSLYIEFVFMITIINLV